MNERVVEKKKRVHSWKFIKRSKTKWSKWFSKFSATRRHIIWWPAKHNHATNLKKEYYYARCYSSKPAFVNYTTLPCYWKHYWRFKIHKCYISPINRHNCHGNLHRFNTQLKGLHKGKKKIVIIQNHYFIYFFVCIHLHLFIYWKLEKNWETLDCCICAVYWDCSCSECES
jgi:hypothetical protein